MIKGFVITLVVFGLVAHGGSYLVYKIMGDGYDWAAAEAIDRRNSQEEDERGGKDSSSERKMAKKRRTPRKRCQYPPLVWWQDQPPATIDEF